MARMGSNPSAGADDFEYSSASRTAGIIIPIVLLVLVIGFVAVMVFNLFGARDAVLSPLREIPVLSEMLPEEGATFAIRPAVDIVEYDEDGEPIQPSPAPDAPRTAEVQELERRIAQLEAQLEAREATLASVQANNDSLSTQVSRLRNYENFIHTYNAYRRQIGEVIANGNPRDFNEWFRYIRPEDAAEIFERTIVTQEIDSAFRRFARPYNDMDAETFAAFAENMLPLYPELLVRILRTKNPARLAAVYEEMNPEILPVITMLMEPTVDPSMVLPEVPVVLPPEINVAGPPVATGTPGE